MYAVYSEWVFQILKVEIVTDFVHKCQQDAYAGKTKGVYIAKGKTPYTAMLSHRWMRAWRFSVCRRLNLFKSLCSFISFYPCERTIKNLVIVHKKLKRCSKFKWSKNIYLLFETCYNAYYIDRKSVRHWKVATCLCLLSWPNSKLRTTMKKIVLPDLFKPSLAVFGKSRVRLPEIVVEEGVWVMLWYM